MKQMKDFVLGAFQFALVEKSKDKFRFKLKSAHANLRTETDTKGNILALIDNDVVLRNHIVKYTRNNYVYFIASITLDESGVEFTLCRKKFKSENIQQSLSNQRFALDAY